MLVEAFAILLLAGPSGGGGGTETNRGTGNDERVVCRGGGMTGSRVARQRVCRTVAEWRLHDEEMREHRRDLDSRRNTSPSPRI